MRTRLTLRQRWNKLIWRLTSLSQRIHNYILVKKYPFLRPQTGWSVSMDYHKPGYKYHYEKTWLDTVPIGWKKLTIELCDKLKQIIEEDHITDYVILQTKEKWGVLCWYYEGGNDRIRKVTSEYEQKSQNVCIRCGKSPTKYVTRGWVTHICEDCAKRYYSDHPDKIHLKKDHEGEWVEIQIPDKYK